MSELSYQPSDTPRTNAAAIEINRPGDGDKLDWISFARQLERELAAKSAPFLPSPETAEGEWTWEERDSYIVLHDLRHFTIRDGTIREIVKAHNTALSALRREVEELRSWKKSMLAVESSWDEQKVGHLLGMTIGTDIRPNILPAILALQKRIETATEALSQLQDINNPMHFGLHPPKAMLDSHEVATNALAALRGAGKAKDSEGPEFAELLPEDQDKIRRQQQ